MLNENDGFEPQGPWPTREQVEAISSALLPGAEAFKVTELDAYPASGEGEHLYVRVQKRGISTMEVLTRLRQCCGLSEAEIGFAGRKDARGLTTQRFSVPRRVESSVAGIEADDLHILELEVHGNKLRLGHLSGNKFELSLNPVEEKWHPELAARAERLRTQACLNYFGPQRLGHNLRSAADGLYLIGNGRAHRRGRATNFLISAAQSVLFNDYIALRIKHECVDKALLGDILKTQRGGMFTCEDEETDTHRVKNREVTVAGPMFGKKMLPSLGSSLTWESEILLARQLSPDSFLSFKPTIPGTRRPILVAVDDLQCLHDEASCQISFALASGSYATVVLRELFGKLIDVE